MATHILILSDIFRSQHPNERAPKEILQFQNLAKILQFADNPFIVKALKWIPTHISPTSEWEKYYAVIRKAIENQLQIRLDIIPSVNEYQEAYKYFQANKLFWDCLQVARVEDREAIEDMILKEPDNNE